jgi:hypothetical protein
VDEQRRPLVHLWAQTGSVAGRPAGPSTVDRQRLDDPICVLGGLAHVGTRDDETPAASARFRSRSAFRIQLPSSGPSPV